MDAKLLAELKENAEAIKFGLFRMGKNRVAAMSTHVHKEVVEELEQRAAKLLADIEKLSAE
jgi:hypothetical protein